MNPEIAQYEQLGKEILRRCISEEDPGEMRRWLTETLAKLGGGDSNAVMSWSESIEYTEQLIAEYARLAETPADQRMVLDWPWASWRLRIDPLDDGMLGVVTAPDGQGKTIFAESIAEHWARRKARVVFVHYELNRKLMMLRRTARWARVTTRDMKRGQLAPEQQRRINELRPVLMGWDGYISYLHSPGWSMERTVAELARLHGERQCDAVVLDYLEKAAPSTRQLRMFGSDSNRREADNVEQLKNWAEMSGVPVLMVAQMSKEGKKTGFDKVDRTAIRGAGEKSEKANLVVLLHRDRVDDGYSNTVDVLVDKNTMGATESWQQVMVPEYFTVGDMA